MREVTFDLTNAELYCLLAILEMYETDHEVEQMAIDEAIDGLEEADEI